jgi:hypothetical protein
MVVVVGGTVVVVNGLHGAPDTLNVLTGKAMKDLKL